MKSSFDGKIALVTGASRGIGREIALEFARRGADVAFNYLRSHKEADQAQLEIEKMGVRCLKIKAHLGDSAKIKEMFDVVEAKFSRIDILVNNAASGVQRSADELKENHWEWAFDINAKAPWLCSIEAARLMTEGGSIVNITSLGSQRVLPEYFSVGVSKAALEALTRYLAVELAPKGISVNAVSGGYVETDALKHFNAASEMLRAGSMNPVGRMVTGSDIAQTVAFLCSQEAEMIRGQVVVVDGGYTLTH